MRAQMYDDPFTTEDAIRNESCDVGITRKNGETWIFYQERLLDEIFARVIKTLGEHCNFKAVAPRSSIMVTMVKSSADAVLEAMGT